MSDETPRESERAPTLHEGCTLTVRGWPTTEEDARRAGETILAIAREVSRAFDLSRLESFVVGTDYRAALASVLRGEQSSDMLPTSNEYGEGAAMAATVIRDDEPWSVVIIWAPLAMGIADREHEGHTLAVHTLIHELAHVHELRLFAKTYPGGWRAAQSPDSRHASLLGMIKPCYSEYIAERSAAWTCPELGTNYLEMLENALRDVDELIRAARYAYRRDHDLGRFWEFVQVRVRFLFQAIGYALGHADWVAWDEEVDPALKTSTQARVDALGSYPAGWVVAEARRALQPFHSLDAFSGMAMFDDLVDLCERLLNQFGVFTSPSGSDVRLDVPVREPWLDL